MFPPHELAQEDGLLAMGGDLTPDWLIAAYRNGIFPWFSAESPVLWWSPDPRMVLEPGQFKISRTLRRTLREGRFQVTIDTAFEEVIEACGRIPRRGQNGTWITDELREGYIAMHRLGLAHSFETWLEGRLVGGLYGVALGKMFYGESMFSHVTEASKVAAAHMARFLHQNGFGLIDCQVYTPHLESLGAHLIPREDFLSWVQVLTNEAGLRGAWPPDGAREGWN